VASASSAEVRAPLLEFAARIVAELGAEGLTMDALAEAAGLSRATIYRRVGSRGKLLEDLAAAGQLDSTTLKRDDVPTRVLEALKRVLAREGFSGATVEHVAAEAGVGPATVYRRFGDREGLFAAFANRFSPRRMARDLAASGGDLESDLRGLARESITFMRGNTELVRLRMSGDSEARRLLGGEEAPQTRMMPTLARYLERQMEAGQLAPADSLSLATAFAGMVTGFGLMGEEFAGDAWHDIDAAAETIVKIFLEGAQSRREAS